MSVNKQILSKFAIMAILLFVSLWSVAANMDSRSQRKVSNSMAKKWSTTSAQDGYQVQESNKVVNIGSKKAGTCNVNIGTVQKGQKAPKEVIVTAKDVINICN